MFVALTIINYSIKLYDPTSNSICTDPTIVSWLL